MDASTTLGVIHAFQENGFTTQRTLSGHLGIALGLANAYIRRCVSKGLVKVQKIPPKRYFYYLTPQGFSEKVRLTREYLEVSLGFFRRARREYSDLYEVCSKRGWRRVVLIGSGELAEIARLAAWDFDITVVGIVDPGRNTAQFANLPVLKSLEQAAEFDAVLLTDIRDSQAAYDTLVTRLPAHTILAPRFLHIIRATAKGGEAE